MAEFHDVGAHCSLATCGRQEFLPFHCEGCGQQFCQDHFTQAAHACPASASPTQEERAPQVSVAAEHAQRCPATGCRELLSSHNTFRCQRCCQDVCIRHRFEEDHPCISVEAAVNAALCRVEAEMAPAKFAEAHRTLLRVFGNVLSDPANEKFRTLKKANAIVQEKLQHPACIEMLRLCGFSDMGEVYACRQAADLSLMRRMTAVLKARPPGTAAKDLKVTSGTGGGTRLVNGVIVREPRAAAEAALAPSSQVPPVPAASSGHPSGPGARAAAGGLPAADSSPTAVGPSGPKPPRSAFDFENRSAREKREQAQQSALQELRQQQKERYRSGGTQSAAAAAQSHPGQQDQQHPPPQRPPAQQQQQDGCVIQ